MLDIAALCLQRWRVLALAALAGAVVGALVAAFSTKIYRAETVLILATRADSSTSQLSSLIGQVGGGLAGLAGFGLGETPGEQVEGIATLRSRQFCERFITERALLPLMFASRWNPGTKSWLSEDDVPTMSEACDRFGREILTVLEDDQTGLVTVRVETEDPARSADWANDLVRRLNAHMRARAIEEAERSIAFLSDELGRTVNVELRSAIPKLIESQIQTSVLARVRQDYLFTVIDPAVSADLDMYERPKPLILVSIMSIFFAALGFVVLLAIEVRRPAQAMPKP